MGEVVVKLCCNTQKESKIPILRRKRLDSRLPDKRYRDKWRE